MESAFLHAYDDLLARWPIPVERIDLRSRHGTTRVNACGPADGPPLVLLHGGGATSTLWYANVGELARTHRVFAIDTIGDRGRSGYDGEPMTGLADLMAWLDSCLDDLSLVRTDLCGHSYGAWVLLRYALHAPARVRRLALLDPTQCFGPQRLNYLLHAVPLFIRPGQTARRRFFRWETSNALDPEVLNFLCMPAGEGSAPKGAKFVWPKRPTDPELRALEPPTLLLLAGNGRQNSVRRLTNTAHRLLPKAVVKVLPTATHHTMPTEPAAELNGHLVDFLV